MHKTYVTRRLTCALWTGIVLQHKKRHAMSQFAPESRTKAKSQPQRVVDGVMARIQGGALKPGDRVPPEPELMREFEVSRTVVREAMSRLQAGGLVETRHGIGTFVLEAHANAPLLGKAMGNIKIRQKLAMLELRISLESEAASLAAARRNEQHLTAMRAALDDYDAHLREGVSTTGDDYRFHVQIAAATGNEYFEEVLCNLGSATMANRGPDRVPDTGAVSTDTGRVGPFGEPLMALAEGKEITQREHESIYDAIRRGDAASARAAMFMHLSNSRERLRNKVGEV
jgi:GntR family transcriptional repressor for pyruvate dehydrogenase complex